MQKKNSRIGIKILLLLGVVFSVIGILAILFPQEGVLFHGGHGALGGTGSGSVPGTEFLEKEDSVNYGILVFIIGSLMQCLSVYLWKADLKREAEGSLL